MSMSQELRSPFLDVDMMNFANGMPREMKYHKGATKRILRLYHEQGSPPGFATRRKQGFTVPMALWLTTTLKSWANEILDPIQLKKDGLFNVSCVRRMWQEHQDHKANHAKALWTVLVFQNWRHTAMKQAIDQRKHNLTNNMVSI